MAQQLLENDDNNPDLIGGSKELQPRSRKKGKIIHCEEIDNGNGSYALNGEIKLLEMDGNNNNNQYHEPNPDNIFFYAPLQLQLQSNDLISFDISYFDDGRPYATNIKIVKYSGVRYTVHIEKIAEDILACSVFNDNQSIEVVVNAQYCINAEPEALDHGSQIEFSLNHDERSNTWTAQRIICLKRKKQKRKYGVIDVDKELIDNDDVKMSGNGQSHDDTIMDSINNNNNNNEMKLPDLNDPHLVANNPPDIIWIEDNERKYKTTKSSIKYDMRIYIDVPFDADDELRTSTKALNEFRPLNHWDRISDTRRQKMNDMQKKCVFLWIRYWCIKIIERKVSIPSFIKFEQFYQIYFTQILNEYINTTIHADENIFRQFINRLNEIVFLPAMTMENNNNNNNNNKERKENEESKDNKKDCLTVGDYNIQNGDTLNVTQSMRVSKIQLWIKTASCSQCIEIEQGSTIYNMKLIIEQKTGIPTSQQQLTNDTGTILKDKATLSDYNIQNGDRFNVEKKKISKIYIKTSGKSKKIELECSPNDTIQNIKAKILAINKVPLECQHLIFAGKTLKDDKTLVDYGIFCGYKIHLIALIKINIKLPTHATIIFTMKMDDSVRSLKLNIQDELAMCVDQQILIFNGNKLDKDHLNLHSYDIKHQSTIELKSNLYNNDKIIDQSTIIETYKTTQDIKQKFSTEIKGLNKTLSESRREINRVSSISSLNSIRCKLLPQITSRVEKLRFFIDVQINALKQKANEAKKTIDMNHKNFIADYKKQSNQYNLSIDKVTKEINEIQQKIQSLQNELANVERMKKVKVGLNQYHCAKINSHKWSRDKRIAEVDAKVADVQHTYYSYIQLGSHDEQLQEIIDEKRTRFEESYESWNVEETIEWIKSIESGYFYNKQFEKFINTIKEMEINGKQLIEMNSKLFLKNTAGLNREKDQHILRKHINRIVKRKNDKEYRNVCGFCAENMIDTVMIPCGHCYSCYQCSTKQNIWKCPLCRKEVMQIVQTFMSGFSKLNR